MKCIFCHHSDKNYIPNYVLYYVEKLSKYLDVTIITNRREIDNPIGEIYLYNNEGYDFGMYSKHITQPFNEPLFLINDSTILFNDPGELIKKILEIDADLVGITSSNEIKPHIQSYWWVLYPNIQGHFIKYLSDMGVKKEYIDVIHTYEIGFCEYIRSLGYKLGSIYNEESSLNPMIHKADIISDIAPLVKKRINYKSIIENKKEDTLNLNYLYEN